MDNLAKPMSVLLKKDDKTKWVLVSYQSNAMDLYDRGAFAVNTSVIDVTPLSQNFLSKETFPMSSDLFEIAPREDFERGDILIRLTDGSKWLFLHYTASNNDMSSISDAADFPSEWAETLCAKAWDDSANDWIKDSHETELPTDEFASSGSIVDKY